jgi:putative oxygen-independent coproporphyrinogen III oxidase
MFSFAAPPPLALYIHIPWCVRKCPYCDFNSHELRRGLPEAAYVGALLADLEQELPEVWGRRLSSIFIGGGTPSLLSPEGLDRLLCGVRARIHWPPGIELSLEANPGTVDTDKLRGFRAAGVNRLSIGAQTFQPELLTRIGRIHGRIDAIGAFESARAAGFGNINLDLMFGLPGQTLAQAVEDVETATALAPEHVSFYQLTIEPNTWFWRHPPELPGDDAVFEMQSRCQDRLAARGYEQYEVSAYARPGQRCRHNLNYWLFGDYVGIGAGAHGKITGTDRITRRWKLKHPEAYVANACTDARTGGENRLSADDAAFEFMMNALRLTEGFPTALFLERTGQPLSRIRGPLQQAEEKGLIYRDLRQIRATALGSRYLNELLVLFLPEETATAPLERGGDDVTAVRVPVEDLGSHGMEVGAAGSS